ncbi:MAG: hypothetical protein MUC38_05430 [Cyclobacteriaceae bacterium]|jgi:hypothetical protein|nr:hypothetical protein [Cyclobacteriaceae bacterium]
MKISELLAELNKRNGLLYYFGWLNMVLLAFALVGWAIDNTIISGINAWIKPLKFAISVTVYAWTFAWLLHYLPHPKQVKAISRLIIVCMSVENAAIFMQAFRGVPSHFNVHSAFDGAVFGTMGLFIALNTLVLMWTFVLFWLPGVRLTAATLAAWRYGVFLFLVGGVSGGIMSGALTHTVGAAEGGDGLPLLNWSVLVGDLRIPHFFTLHGLQVMGLFGVWSSKRTASPVPVTLFFIGYCVFCIALHVIALEGKSPVSF